MSRMDGSRLYSRRQSEPFGFAGRTLSEVHRMLNTNLIISEESDKKFNKVLHSTLPGSASGRPGVSRLLARRGTVAQTDGIRLLSSGRQDHPSKELSTRGTSSASGVKVRPRRGSLPLNEHDLKCEQDPGASKKAVEVTKKRRASMKQKSYRDQNGVNVSFYNEETGEECIPSLKDKAATDDADKSSDDDTEHGDNLKGTVWKEVAKCRYIRGYNPPEMREPDTDHATFVFGRDYNEVIDAQRRKASIDQA